MRLLAALFAAALLAGCGESAERADARLDAGPPPPPTAVQDSSAAREVEFLLASSAADFQAHRPPTPVDFREVRLGHLTTSSSEAQYLLCGEFLPAEGGDAAAWMRFATIRTAPYEQLLGGQADGVCGGGEVRWVGEADHAAALQERYDALP